MSNRKASTKSSNVKARKLTSAKMTKLMHGVSLVKTLVSGPDDETKPWQSSLVGLTQRRATLGFR